MSKFLLLSAHFLRKDTHPLHQKTQNKKRNLCHDLCIKNIQMQAGSIHAQKYIIKIRTAPARAAYLTAVSADGFLWKTIFVLTR